MVKIGLFVAGESRLYLEDANRRKRAMLGSLWSDDVWREDDRAEYIKKDESMRTNHSNMNDSLEDNIHEKLL